jgi:propionyl-CoA carboxylase beta chain
MVCGVSTVTNEEVTQEALGGAETHTTISGVAHGAFDNDVLAIRGIRELFEYLPLSNKDVGPVKSTSDPRDRREESLRYMVPDDANQPYDMLSVVKKVVDEGSVFEIMPDFARNIVCGFARMEGRTVGVSAPCPAPCPASLAAAAGPWTD